MGGVSTGGAASAPRAATSRLIAPAVGAGDQALLAGKPAELSWRDYLIMLMRIGAEIEHGLMVQYLYAGYSLGAVNATQRFDHAGMWQDELLAVAREEMGHLMSMQNALRLVGGAPNFDRRDLPWDSDFYPFPLRLEPFTIDALAKYVYAEMDPTLDTAPPPGRRLPRAERQFEAERQELFDEVKRALHGETAHHVAKLFERILAIVRDTQLVPDSWFHAETYAAQAGWDEWGKGYRPHELDSELPDPHQRPDVIVARMASRTQLVQALEAVAAQGEAPNFTDFGTRSPSHFDRFFEVYGTVRPESKQVAELVQYLPTDPTTERGADGAYIAHDGSRALAHISNLRYRMLLTNLAHSMRTGASDVTAERGAHGFLLQRTFADMFNVKTLAGLLFRAPLTATPGDLHRAGPPFEMPYSTVLPAADVDCWRLQLDLADRSAALVQELLTERSPERAAPAEAVRYLRTLVQLDRQDADRIRVIIASHEGGR